MLTGLSDCCGAPIIKGDICSDCKEHCGEAGEEEQYGNNDNDK